GHLGLAGGHRVPHQAADDHGLLIAHHDLGLGGALVDAHHLQVAFGGAALRDLFLDLHADLVALVDVRRDADGGAHVLAGRGAEATAQPAETASETREPTRRAGRAAEAAEATCK